MGQFTCYCRLTHLQPLRGLSNVQICLHSCCVIVRGVFFLLLLCSVSYILVMLARFCAMLLFLCTAGSARILALVLQLYERNKLNWKKSESEASRCCSLYPSVCSVRTCESVCNSRYTWGISAGPVSRKHLRPPECRLQSPAFTARRCASND